METKKENETDANIPRVMVQSRVAFLRDLPTLLANPKYDRWCAAYYGDERIGIAESEIELLRECERRGLRPDQYYMGAIFPRSGEDIEEIESGLHELEEDEEITGALSFVEYDDDHDTFSGPALGDVRSTP